jgi:PDZ domain
MGAAALVTAIALLWPRTGNGPAGPLRAQLDTSGETAATAPLNAGTAAAVFPRPKRFPAKTDFATRSSQPALATLSKSEQLAQLRDTFRALAAGDPATAMRAARQLTNEVERETALLTLVTEWKHGELSSPRQRAWAIASLGLEAGLGTELAGNPELAQLWAAEFTNSPPHTVAPDRLGAAMGDADPTGALAYADQLPPDDRGKFLASLFTTWAQSDTDAALQQAQQMTDPAEQQAALNAIRSVAPVGIGVALSMQDGYPVVNQMLPGAPAELSGQLHQGDRIVGVAQGNSAYVDTRNLPLQDIVQAIRGAPGTTLQLQILPAGAAPDSQPVTVPIVRDQIKYKR